MLGTFEKEELGSLNFGLGIDGDFEKVTEVRLSLSSAKGNLFVEGKVDLESEEVSFDLSSLRDYIPSGHYNVKMEVILDGNRYFNPLKESLEIKKALKVEATAKEVTPPTKKETKVTVNASTIQLKSPKDLWIETQESMGNTVIESADKKKLISMKGKVKVSEFCLAK